MGYAVEWRPDPDNVYLCGHRDNLALHRGHPRERTASLDHIGIAVAEPDHVDAWAAHLQDHGVELKTRPKTHRDGSRSIYFYGPERLIVQIIHHGPMLDG